MRGGRRINRSKKNKRRMRRKTLRGGNETKGMELVVTRYNEGLRWINDLPKGMLQRIKIYNKGTPMDYVVEGAEVIPLENVGREPHAFLTHIINNYDNGDYPGFISLFVPGSVMVKPHKSKQLDRILEALKHKHESIILSYGTEKEVIEREKDFALDDYLTTDNDNKKLNPDSKVDIADIRPLGKWFNKYFPGEEINCIATNCIFAVTKRDILKRKKEFYEVLLGMVKTLHPEEVHYIERVWGVILSIENCEPFKVEGHEPFKKK